jgi:hypothetical protein
VRTGDWLKIKCVQSDSFFVVGFEPSSAIARLLLARKDGDAYVYVGSVGNVGTLSRRKILRDNSAASTNGENIWQLGISHSSTTLRRLQNVQPLRWMMSQPRRQKAGAKAAGVVINDAAVTPRYVVGLSPARELPIIGKIALGSLKDAQQDNSPRHCGNGHLDSCCLISALGSFG